MADISWPGNLTALKQVHKPINTQGITPIQFGSDYYPYAVGQYTPYPVVTIHGTDIFAVSLASPTEFTLEYDNGTVFTSPALKDESLYGWEVEIGQATETSSDKLFILMKEGALVASETFSNTDYYVTTVVKYSEVVDDSTIYVYCVLNDYAALVYTYGNLNGKIKSINSTVTTLENYLSPNLTQVYLNTCTITPTYNYSTKKLTLTVGEGDIGFFYLQIPSSTSKSTMPFRIYKPISVTSKTVNKTLAVGSTSEEVNRVIPIYIMNYIINNVNYLNFYAISRYSDTFWISDITAGSALIAVIGYVTLEDASSSNNVTYTSL